MSELAPKLFVDLGELIGAVAEQYADRQRIEVRTNGDAAVLGDEDRLRQVFSNLVDNAVKYSPNGAEPEITITGSRDEVEVRVRDQGIGVPAAELSTIFDRFARASNARRLRISGTGFGLFMTKQLVQLHGGTIAVDSHEGEGSTFIVTLPRRVARSRGPRTVIIFDRERDGSFLGHGLREGGYRVRTAGSIDELMAIADSESVDAVVMNVDATELASDQAARLRAFTRKNGIPIVAVGGEGSAHLGAIVNVPKPVLTGDVMAALERIRP